MAKSPYERALEKQTKEVKKQADDSARRERAKSIVEGQPIKNGLRILDGNAEQLLKIILDAYDGGETGRVSVEIARLPENLRLSLGLELERLIMYGVISSTLNIGSNREVYLSPQGKSYFEDKENANQQVESTEVSHVIRKQYDVFISHASTDKYYVDDLVKTLNLLDITVFYDRDSLSWGDNWKRGILEGIEKSEFAIIVISHQFFKREWTERELNEFLQLQNDNGQKIILPLLLGISFEDLKEHYPDLESIQSIKANDYTKEKITIQLAKELIKRYR